MGGGTGSGLVYNLYDQDFTDVVAFATSPAGEMFFAAVFDGAIPLLQYAGEGATICLGKVECEDEDVVLMMDAIQIAPCALLRVQEVTNYCPRDCLRALWFELKQLLPNELTTLRVPKRGITRRFGLDKNAPELPEDLVKPLYAVFVDDNSWQLRGFEWPTTSMFWQPQSRRLLASVNYFRQVDGYLVSSLVDMDVSDFASDSTWNQATIQSFTTGVSKDRMREQDILRAIDSFDAFSRHTPQDEEACDALSQYVTEVLRKNNAWDVIEWFGRTNFPMRTNDALTLYELMDLSRNVRRVLSELAVGRDSGVFPQDETITLPGELFIYRHATVHHGSTSVWWDKTGNEGDVVEDEDISGDWLELLARHEEVDLAALHKTLRDFCPAVQKLDEEPEKWKSLVDLASQFARNLQTT